MSTTVIEDQIRMYAKLLKIPTFTTYKEALRQLSPDSDISEILLSLMKQSMNKGRKIKTCAASRERDFHLPKHWKNWICHATVVP